MLNSKTMIALSATAMLAAAAGAQYSNNNQQSNSQNRQNSSSQNSGSQSSSSQNAQSRQSPLDWQSTTVVGYDFDNDGRVDAYYTTTRYELEQMKQRASDYQRSSQSRYNNQNSNRQSSYDDWYDNRFENNSSEQYDPMSRSNRYTTPYDNRYGTGYDNNAYRNSGYSQYDNRYGNSYTNRYGNSYDNQYDSNRSGNQYDNSMNRNSQYQPGYRDQNLHNQTMMNSSKTFDGTIKSVKNFNLTGLNGPRTIARVQTDDGQRVAVILGSQSDMQNMDLAPGDDVKFRVRKGSINNRQVLVADRVRVNGRTYQIQQQKADDLKRINGTVVDTMTRTLENRNGDSTKHLLLKVQNADGRTCVVTLGPASQRDASRLSRGEDVSILASPTMVNGRQIYSARTFYHDGQTKRLTTTADNAQSRNRNSSSSNRSSNQNSGG